MSPELWFGLFGCASAVFTAGWAVLAHFSNRRYQEELRTKKEERAAISKEVNDAVKTGQGMVKVNDEKIEAYQKYNTQQFESITERVVRLEKGHNTLNSQLMTEHKVDSKLEPIKEDIEETKKELMRVNDNLSAQMKELRSENKEANTLQEMHTQQLFSKVANIDSGMARIEGYLRAKAESKLDD
jgi:uncharacterized phage infection (PIP) family protein YhgE